MVYTERYIEQSNRTWALYPMELAVWLRSNPIKRPRVLGEKFTTGLVLSCITGDDSNCFNMVIQQLREPDSAEELKKTLHDGRLSLLDRLRWEKEEPATPAFIRRELVRIHKRIEQIPWTDRSSFDEARGIWVTVQRFVSDSVKDEPRLKSAVDYHFDLRSSVGKLYEASKNSSNS